MSRQTIGSSPSRGPGPWLGLLLALAPACQEERATPDAQAPEIQQLLNDPWVYTDWRSWGEEDGLPHHLVFAVKVHGGKVYVGTEDGVGILDRETGRWQTLKQESSPGAGDGLAFRVVTSVEIDEDGHAWFGTFKGLTWWDGERFTNFRMPEGQLPTDPAPTGLVNNVVYAVTHQGSEIWVATTDGVSVHDKADGSWKTWYLDNAPMDETWCYGITASPDRIWLAAWGSGLMEYKVSEGAWQTYHDPDGSFAIDLMRDDGMLSMMSVAASHDEGLTWVATYFGVSVYDGKNWRDWDEDHGLPSNFLNSVKARGRTGWASTDKGLAGYVDGRWYLYARDGDGEDAPGTLTITDSDGENGRVYRTRTALPHDFVWGVDFDEAGDIWVATSDGLGHGTRAHAAGGGAR
jgi:ligand-binding sensor domain-containing protein